ncbi:MAG: cytochrome ubiquinol oxidase subunit I, partial [Mycobacterium leprae]
AWAPLKLGGIVDLQHQELKYAIPLPGGLSILAFNNPNAVVKGLDTVPQSDWPAIGLVHYAFDIMIGAGVVMLLIAAAYWWLRRKRGEAGVLSTGLLKWLVVGTPLGLIALECGWIVTEVGRQPWIIWHVMRTTEAVTTAPGLPLSVSGFVLLYAILTVALLWLLKRLKAVR